MKTKDKVTAALALFTSLLCAVCCAKAFVQRDWVGVFVMVGLGFVNVATYTRARRGK